MHTLKECFKNHKANLIVNMDTIKVLDWKEDGTSMYWIRYVITNYFMSIHGDCGSGTFKFTWNPTFKENWKISMDYFLEKMTSSKDKYEWCEEDALADLNEYIASYEDPTNDEIEEANIVKVAIKNSHGSYNNYINLIYEDCEDPDRYDSFGQRHQVRHQLWLLGLQMASEQLRGDND